MKRKSAASPPTAHPEGKYLVFLSHATHDKWIAEVVQEKIEAGCPRIKVWRDDRDINGGDRIPDAILEAITSCRELLVLVTPASRDRVWVQLEVGAAWGLRKRVVPLFYHVDPASMFDVLKERRGYQLQEMRECIRGLQERSEAEASHGSKRD